MACPPAPPGRQSWSLHQQARRPVHSGRPLHRDTGRSDLRRGPDADHRSRLCRPRQGHLCPQGARCPRDQQAAADRRYQPTAACTYAALAAAWHLQPFGDRVAGQTCASHHQGIREHPRPSPGCPMSARIPCGTPRSPGICGLVSRSATLPTTVAFPKRSSAATTSTTCPAPLTGCSRPCRGSAGPPRP